jgi:hypothetical protein
MIVIEGSNISENPTIHQKADYYFSNFFDVKILKVNFQRYGM